MRIENRTNHRGGVILTGMIVNDTVCGQVASVWDKEGLFSSPWENTIGGWAVRYYKRHARAPKKNIEVIYQNWAEGGHKDKDTIKLVGRFLENLSGRYIRTNKDINPQFVVDLAAKHFEAISIDRYADSLKAEVEAGKLGDAKKRMERFKTPQIGLGAGIDLLLSKEDIKEAFEEKRESLVKYPGAIGRFFGDELEREGFIAFMGPEKRGKTWWLMDLAWRAMLERRKVAFFEVGDLSKRQIIRRFGVRASRIPMRETRKGHPLIIPKTIELVTESSDSGFIQTAKVTNTIKREFKSGMSWQEGWQAFKKVQREKVRSNNSYFKLSVHATRSISVSSIRTIIDQWSIGGWIPDIVVIDYADILAPPAGFVGDSRDAVNETWMALRRMSQELHCLVVTATQAKATSYSANRLDMTHFSEDHRKFAHVTGMVGINQSEEEKENGIQSLNWLVLREDEFLTKRCVFIAGCLGLANPCMVSAMAF